MKKLSLLLVLFSFSSILIFGQEQKKEATALKITLLK